MEAARQIQRERLNRGIHESPNDITCNAGMRPGDIQKYCQLDEAGSSLMRTAMQQMQLSARAYHRVLKLARTIADLAEEDQIAPIHLAEVLQYGPKQGMM